MLSAWCILLAPLFSSRIICVFMLLDSPPSCHLRVIYFLIYTDSFAFSSWARLLFFSVLSLHFHKSSGVAMVKAQVRRRKINTVRTVWLAVDGPSHVQLECKYVHPSCDRLGALSYIREITSTSLFVLWFSWSVQRSPQHIPFQELRLRLSGESSVSSSSDVKFQNINKISLQHRSGLLETKAKLYLDLPFLLFPLCSICLRLVINHLWAWQRVWVGVPQHKWGQHTTQLAVQLMNGGRQFARSSLTSHD